MMETPFYNDPLAILWMAFKRLYPERDCKCAYMEGICVSEDGDDAYGMTTFGDDGTVQVLVDAGLPITDVTEVLCHELAHVAAGVGHDHDEIWGAAFEALFAEYHRLGAEMFREDAAHE